MENKQDNQEVEERIRKSRQYGELCLRNEAKAILDLIPQMDDEFVKAVEMMYHCNGKSS